MEHNNWNGFKKGVWQDEINVRDFIQQNYKEYTGDSSFLAPATDRTNAMMKKLNSLFALNVSLAVCLILIQQLYLHLQAMHLVILTKKMNLSLVCRQTSL